MTAEAEPMCSKFAYEKQMIEAMVRMEVKMEQWDKQMKGFQENILSTFELRREEMDGTFDVQKKQMEKLIAENNAVHDNVRNQTQHLQTLAGTDYII